MSVAYINSDMLVWARERAGLPSDELLRVNRKYSEWEAGHAMPTFRQAQILAAKLHIPFGFLYLSQPPIEKPLTVDLRTFHDAHHGEFSLELRDVITDAKRKQEWYRDYLIDDDAIPLDFIGKYSKTPNVDAVANDIEETLLLSLDDREGISKGDFLSYLTAHAEDAGILVIRNGKVGANTSRILDVEEFRGFCLPDSYAPLVFVNTADFEAAQIFTLVHELVHLWIGEEGVSDWGLSDTKKHDGLESFCNQVAVEVLVPQRAFEKLWADFDGTLEEKSEALCKKFKVSSIVIARRALDSGFVDGNEFYSFYKDLRVRWRTKRSASGGGGNFYNSFPIANSKVVTDAVCHAAFSGNLLLRDAASLLGVKPSTLTNYAQRQGVS